MNDCFADIDKFITTQPKIKANEIDGLIENINK